MAVLTRRGFLFGGLAVAGQAQKMLVEDADFSQWRSAGAGLWAAEGSELVGRFARSRPGLGYLFTSDEFTDFRLTMLFRISSGGLGGIYLREPRRKWSLQGEDRPGFGPTGGYEVLVNYQDPDNPTGTITNTQKSKKSVGGEEKWNEMEIFCKGAEIRISVAGQIVNRFNQLRIQPGIIGFGVGFGVPGAGPQDFTVRFRDIKITSVK